MSTILPGVCAASAAIALVAGVRKSAHGGPPVWLRFELVGRTRPGKTLARSLERAGVALGPDTFVCTIALGGAVVAFAVFALIQSPLIAALTTAGAVAVPVGVVRSADRRYLGRLADQLPMVAQQLSGAVAAGLSLGQGVSRVSEDAPEPASSELRRLTRELDLGVPIDEALEGMVERLPDGGLRTMVTAIQVQRVAGGNLSAALTDLSYRLEDNAVLEREARGMTAQARMSAWLVSALPVVGGIMAELASPGMLARTLGHGIGLVLLVIASGLQVLGVMMIRRLMGRATG